jgi:hypothetical protein
VHELEHDNGRTYPLLLLTGRKGSP